MRNQGVSGSTGTRLGRLLSGARRVAISAPGRMRDPHSLDHIVELAPAHSDQLGGVLLNVSGSLQRFDDEFSLDIS